MLLLYWENLHHGLHNKIYEHVLSKGIKNGFLSYQISEMLPYTLHGFRIYMIKNVLFMIKLYFKIIDTFFFDNVDPIVLQIIQCSVNYKCFSGK